MKGSVYSRKHSIDMHSEIKRKNVGVPVNPNVECRELAD